MACVGINFLPVDFFIKGDDNRLKNLTIENTSYPREKAGQAIALFAEGDFTGEGLVLRSYQDTLFTGPLPYKEKEPGGFRGPTEFDERIPAGGEEPAASAADCHVFPFSIGQVQYKYSVLV